MKHYLKINPINIKLFLISFPFLLLLSLHSTTFSYYGAKYEPPDGKIYHGLGWHKQSQINYMAMFPADRLPLLVQHMIPLPGNRGMTTQKILDAFNADHLYPDSQYMEVSAHFSDNVNVLDSLFAHTGDLDSCIDTLAKALLAHNKPVFLRIGLEMNGAWNGYTPWTFPKAYRKLVEELRDRGVKNIATVWCYEPDAPADFADSTVQGWKWYPGDDVVDWFSLDPFPKEHFDPSLPDSVGGEITKKGKSELFLKFAEERGKPVYLNETTAHSVHITPDSLDIDSADGIHDWGYWFAPFPAFLQTHPDIKAFNYINLDWTPYPQWAHWGDARIEINSYISKRWVDSLSNEKFLCAGYKIPDSTGIHINPEQISSKTTFTKISIRSFSNTIAISYSLTATCHVTLEILTIKGQAVTLVTNENQHPGNYSRVIQKKHLSKGLYFLKAKFNNNQTCRKVIIYK